MGFVSICTAVYDYQPQSAGELELKEGDILYILEKSTEDDWWKAKKRAAGEDEDEPEGLIPNNYVEDAQHIHTAKALYDYARQTEEEVSFSEDALIHVYDVSDPDWTLVAVDGDYGFAPANYIEISDTATTPRSPAAVAVPSRSYAPEPEQQPSPPASPTRDYSSAAARLADVLGGVAPASPPATRAVVSPPLPVRQPTPEASDEEPPPPPKPQRPQSQTIPTSAPAPAPIAYYEEDTSGIRESPSIRLTGPSNNGPISPGGYHLYNISEMVSAMGKRKKIPITLGLNITTGTIMLSPEKSRDGPTQEWTAEKLEHYSIEGKHVFLELNRPSKSLDLHAGAKDTAREIVAGLGEIAGAHRAEGLKEVITASAGGAQKKGVVLYDFMAQGDDEVTVAEGDEVVVLDDTKSEEWWNVRRLKNGKEGVVPSSYIEITGTVNIEPPSRSGVNAGLSPVEQNRLEEQRLAKEAARADRAKIAAEQARSQREVALPERDSSLADEERRSSKKDKRSSKSNSKPRSAPDQSKVRTWTDHSGSFKVDAQFLGVADGKIHLHKVNGVKIAVPISKMSQPDLDYVEKVTRESIEDIIPVADLIKMKRRNQTSESSRAGATIDRDRSPASQPNKPPDYDWFDFFLTAGVGPHQCERYAQAMIKDSMDESVLPDIKMETLRTLGIKEGDALKVMKYLDQRYGRNRGNGEPTDGQAPGLFSGPGGALKNNTSRQRPEANRTASNTVTADAFQPESSSTPVEAKATPPITAPGQFDDDAWTPKPASKPAATPTPPPPAPPSAPFSENLYDLSTLLDKPLEPTPVAPPRPASQPQVSTPVQQPQQTGATPQLFQQVASQLAQPGQQSNTNNLPQIQSARQRPLPPQQSLSPTSGLLPPPRPLSAPQNAQQNQFGLQPLQAQLTGVANSAHPAPPGQSLDELTAQRMQQYLRPQQTGYIQNGFQPQPTGYPQQQFGQLQQPFLNGNVAGSPFADPRLQPQTTSYGGFQQGGVNAGLPPALIPQRTGFVNQQPQLQQNGFNQFQPQQTGYQPSNIPVQPTGFQPGFQPQQTGFPQALQPQQTGFAPTNGFGHNNFPPVPPIPQQPTPAPLVTQKTGAPDIKFGVKKLQPQPTGRRANLAQASKFIWPLHQGLRLMYNST